MADGKTHGNNEQELLFKNERMIGWGTEFAIDFEADMHDEGIENACWDAITAFKLVTYVHFMQRFLDEGMIDTVRKWAYCFLESTDSNHFELDPPGFIALAEVVQKAGIPFEDECYGAVDEHTYDEYRLAMDENTDDAEDIRAYASGLMKVGYTRMAEREFDTAIRACFLNLCGGTAVTVAKICIEKNDFELFDRYMEESYTSESNREQVELATRMVAEARAGSN